MTMKGVCLWHVNTMKEKEFRYEYESGFVTVTNGIVGKDDVAGASISKYIFTATI